jgi:hypothetical protein
MCQQRIAIAIQDEGRLDLALQAYQSGQFRSLWRAAAAFTVTHQKLSDRLYGITVSHGVYFHCARQPKKVRVIKDS